MSNTVLEGILLVCERHAKRLGWAMGKIKPLVPMTSQQFESLTPEEVSYFEVFTTRFAKLQDVMGAKLFPKVLELMEEPGEFPAFIDKLNALEKMQVIDSAEGWLDFRKVRNQFAHDYPDDSAQNSTVLNHAYQLAPRLLTVFKKVKQSIDHYRLKKVGGNC